MAHPSGETNNRLLVPAARAALNFDKTLKPPHLNLQTKTRRRPRLSLRKYNSRYSPYNRRSYHLHPVLHRSNDDCYNHQPAHYLYLHATRPLRLFSESNHTFCIPCSSPLPPNMMRPAFAVFLLVLSLSATANAQDNWAAAECAGLGPKCPRSIARKSGHCFKRLYMSSQPKICRKAACEYCTRLNRRVTQSACRREPIVKNCFNGRRLNTNKKAAPQQSNKKKNKPNPSGTCRTFLGKKGKIVIPTNRLKLNSAWAKNSDGSITWRPNGGSGIDAAGTGTICASFKVPSPGSYYMTVVSKAPHPTEYNDAWFKLNAGFRLYRPQGNSWKGGGSGWMKGYQNEGRNRKANYLVTIDFNGHQFISNPLSTSKPYQVCISGRSSMYTIYELIFIKCDGSFGCNRFNSPIKNAMRSLPSPRC